MKTSKCVNCNVLEAEEGSALCSVCESTMHIWLDSSPELEETYECHGNCVCTACCTPEFDDIPF